MTNHSTSTTIRRVARLSAPVVFGLAVLACGDGTGTIDTGGGAVPAAVPAAQSAHPSADALDRRAANAPESAHRSPDAIERWALNVSQG